MDSILIIVIIIFSVVIHEVAHGYAAYFFGDPTAKLSGRLTLNPIKHVDIFGSIILPGILILLSSNFLFGWAKPVPVNPYNFKNKRLGEGITALVGPASNLFIALFFAVIIRYSPELNLSVSFIQFCSMIVMANVGLAILNIMPVPPLDGSRVLMSLIPDKFYKIKQTFESNQLLFALLFIVLLWNFIDILIIKVFSILVGLPM